MRNLYYFFQAEDGTPNVTVLSHEGKDAMSLFSPSVKPGKNAFFCVFRNAVY